MKPHPTFFVNVKLWLHSDMYLGSLFLDPADIKCIRRGPSGTLVKEQGPLELIWGTKGPPIKA